MLTPRTIADYNDDVTRISKSVLREVMTVLTEYRPSLVLIGGWAPYFLLDSRHAFEESGSIGFGAPKFRHAGSIDIDLAVDSEKITGKEYKTIVKLLGDRGYKEDETIKFRLNRSVPGLESPIAIDFMTSQPQSGKGRAHRHREVQSDLPARATEHLELAFLWNQTHSLDGDLPEGGGRVKVEFKLASFPAVLALKGLALGNRYKEKDAYDVYALCRHYSKEVGEIAGIVRPHLEVPGMRQALSAIRGRFTTAQDAGPSWVGKFFDAASQEERDAIAQDAFQTVDKVLRDCGI